LYLIGIYSHVAEKYSRKIAMKQILFPITVVNNPNKYFGEYVGRPSILGNPYTRGTREEVIDAYNDYIRQQIAEKNTDIVEELERLYKIAKIEPLRLICWCAPLPCHANIIKNIILEHHDSKLW